MLQKAETLWRPSWVWLLPIAYTFATGTAGGFAAAAQASRTAGACAGAEAALRAAGKSLDAGSLVEAQRLLAPLGSAYPRCSEFFVVLARLRAAQNDRAAAEQLFFRALELAPQDARPYYYTAQFYFSIQQYQKADSLSQQAVTRDPAYPDGLILRGQILAMKGQPVEARQMLEKACALDPRNPEAHFQLGVFLDGRQLHPEAVEQFARVVALRPNDARAYDYMALNLESLSEPGKAESAYQKGLGVNKGPYSDDFLEYNYGRFLMKANRLTESKTYLDRALRSAPQTRAVYYEHGKLNLRLQKYKDAQADAERALSLRDPSGFVLDLQVYYLLATIYTRLGNTELAEKYAALCRTSRVPIQAQGRGEH